MNQTGRVLALITVLGWAGAAAADLPDRSEYAYRFPLGTQGDSEFFTASVPLDLYRSVTDPRLRDAGVFNAVGQAVPRIFERPESGPDDPERELTLGLVPLHGDAGGQQEQLRLLLQQAESGITLELDAGPETGSADPLPLSAYIVDTRDLEEDVRALVFAWPEQPQGFIGRVTVEHSGDLQNWRNLGAASLADLAYGDTRILQDRIDLRGAASDFLRITWRAMPDAWRLVSVSGIYTVSAEPIDRDELDLQGVPAEGSDREYLFDARGAPPVDRVNLRLPDENVVVRASVWHRPDSEQRWRRAHSGVFYNVSRQGNALRSSPAAIGETRSRYWKVRLESGATAGPVRLHLAWRPDRLVFLAQGAGPFELAAGRGRDRLDQFPMEAVLGDRAIFDMLRESGTAGDATIGARQVGGGPARLEAAPRQTWRKLALWAGLTAAIALVGWLVWSLARQMGEEVNSE